MDETSELFDKMLQRENLLKALGRVRQNGGAPGVDGMTVEELGDYLREHWPRIREELQKETYQPAPVRKVEIPKPGGKGMRTLGIPTVLDRLLQQALLQVLEPLFDPTFSEGSYGFRPGRGTHQAIEQARAYVTQGRTWVVDLDLEKFFDRVNHDVLMARVARRVKDKRVLRLIRRFLEAGMMAQGLVEPRTEGTPQGGPLSPLLSNILLDDLDKELERRGHRFVRYADDCNVYVQSEAAGRRVMDSLERLLRRRLRLRINREKSAVARPWERKFLGYTVTRRRPVKLKVSPASVKRLKDKLRPILRSGRGRTLGHTIGHLKPILAGWRAYFGKAEVKSAFQELDEWIRRKLRAVVWRQWKTPAIRVKQLECRGIPRTEAKRAAYSACGPWRMARLGVLERAIPTAELRRSGLVMLVEQQTTLEFST
jgi:RNA-directed DNA polymerase